MTCTLKPYGVYLDSTRAIILFCILTSCSVTLTVRLRIPGGSFLVFPTSYMLYALRGGLGAACGGGVVDVSLLHLSVGMILLVMVGGSGGGVGGGDDEELPRPEIK